jgi:hypothetical protein
LKAAVEVNAVRKNLRTKTGERRESSYAYGVCAVYQMPVGDGRMFANDQLRLPVRFTLKKTFIRSRKPGNPVEIAQMRLLSHLQKEKSFANCEASDMRTSSHFKMIWANKGKADFRRGVDLVAQQRGHHVPTDSPWDDHQYQGKQALHRSSALKPLGTALN